MSRTIFEPKKSGEIKSYYFDFSSLLPTGVTVSGQSVTASVYSGTDASPSVIISGSASLSGNIVKQNITAGTIGVIYQLVCRANLSDGQTRDMTAFLAIEPNVT